MKENAVCTWKPRRLEQIVDIPVPLIEEEIAEVNRFLHWSVTQATVSLSSAESEAKAITNGCIEALYVKHLLEHQTARTFKIEVWTDSSSAKVIIQRLGPGRRAKHLEVQTMWVQQLNKLGLISMNKLGTLENVADMMTKHVPRGVLDKLAGTMGYSFSGEETAKFQDY